jgi:hypothetical protein
MMYSVVLIALWGFAPAITERPAWLTDYAQARKLSQLERKPMAVFVSSGKTGWNDLSRDGRLDKDADRLLANSYVCLYVDTAGEEGRRLAQAFELSQPRGIVISDSGGKLQAFRHEGNLRHEDLLRHLARFSNTDLVVTHTETDRPPIVSAPVCTSRG